MFVLSGSTFPILEGSELDYDALSAELRKLRENVAGVTDTSTLGDDLGVDIAALDGPNNRTGALLASIALAARAGGTDVKLRGSSTTQLARLDDLGLGDMFSR